MSSGESTNKHEQPSRFSRIDKLLLFLSCLHVNPESSLRLRFSVMMCELVALFSTFSALEFPDYWYLYPLFLVIGHIYSYYFRYKNACLIKALVSVYMMLLLKTFFQNLIASPYNIGQIFVNLLAGLVVGHSFDLPKRRDLNYSLIVSLLLISFSATVFNKTNFSLHLLLYFTLFINAIYFHNLSYQADNILLIADSKHRRLHISELCTFVSIFILTVLLVFLFMPRYPGLADFRMQTTFDLSSSLNFAGIKSKYGELIGADGPVSKNRQGNNKNNDLIAFESYDNLREDNDLKETNNPKVLMHIRTNSQGVIYCRGLVYTLYDGSSWKTDDFVLPTEIESTSYMRPIPRMFSRRFYKDRCMNPTYLRKRPQSEYVTHIFSLETNFDNVIFSPYFTQTIDYPTNTIYIDSDNGLRSHNIQEKGTIYTTYSFAPNSPEDLGYSFKEYEQFLNDQPSTYEIKSWEMAKNYHGEADRSGIEITKLDPNLNKKAVKKYLQLPDNITERTRFLAVRLTAPYRTPFLKVMALCHFLRSNCAYNLSPTPCPDDMEPNDYFLFENKEGTCRNFASALAVMCRSIGLMSRYIGGYATEDSDLFSGDYVVRSNNTHAWTEVFLFSEESLWLPIDAVSPNYVVNNQKQQGASFGYSNIANNLLKFLAKSYSEGSYKNYVYFLKAFILLSLALLAGYRLVKNADLVHLIIGTSLNKGLSIKKRFYIIIKLFRLRKDFSKILQTDNLSETEQMYSAMVMILADLHFCKSPSQTPHEFLQTVTNQRLQPLLQSMTKDYENNMYKQAESTVNKSYTPHLNLRQAWEKLSAKHKKMLLLLLSLTVSNKKGQSKPHNTNV
ncbi:MAG: transglutaminaseTgpA domain-containing protein [Candidatus Bruticola sp.]